MNKPPFFPIATSAPTLELHDERVDLPTNRAPTLEPHDEEVELPTSTAEAQVVEGPAFLKVQGVIVEVENKSKQPSSSNENLDSSSTSNGGGKFLFYLVLLLYTVHSFKSIFSMCNVM